MTSFMEEVEQLTEEVVAWIDRELGRDYAWPGNFRELGQCVRNVMIRGSYRPPRALGNGKSDLGPVDELLRQVPDVELTADDLLARYYALALHRCHGSYAKAGRLLKVDWRVVKSRHDAAFLETLRQSNRQPASAGASSSREEGTVTRTGHINSVHFGSVKVSGLTLSSTLNPMISELRNFSPSRLASIFVAFLMPSKSL